MCDVHHGVVRGSPPIEQQNALVRSNIIRRRLSHFGEGEGKETTLFL